MSWRDTVVARGATHHELEGKPLYTARYDEVLSFHKPGIAAVRRDDEAWHIDVRGEPTYARRFARTFGYYEGLAAVAGEQAWGFIDVEGKDIGPHDFAWCGNFQSGRATVRDRTRQYFHVTSDIRPAYTLRWRYAGDFRHGLAVVQGDSGLSTHIDHDGALLHGRWFVDLDVFHKGFARARDNSGWMHIDLRGEPLYGRRFTAVEPFYNGQARVERDDGGLEVIDECGQTLIELRPARADPFAELSRLLVGHWSTDTIASAVQLGVFEHLPATLPEAAARTDLPHDKTRRLLRALAELGLVEEANGTWRLRPHAQYLRENHVKTLAGAALEYAGPLRDAWQKLPEALRTKNWRPNDPFADLATQPTRIARHTHMLASYARHDYNPLVGLLPIHLDTLVIDAGGGCGELARAIASHYSDVRVSLLERPEIVRQAEKSGLPSAITAIAADLFTPWPVRGNLVVFSRVLHDWDNAEALVLLKNARSALLPEGKLVIIELLLDERGFGGGLCDLHLLAVTGGRERTFSDFKSLLVQAGFEPPQLQPTSVLPQLLITRPT